MNLGRFLRDHCWPTLTTLIGVALLLSLGTWQMRRLIWKEDVLQEISTKFARPVQDIDLLFRQPMATIRESEYQRIKASGIFLYDEEIKLMSKSHDGQLGYHLITPLRLDAGPTLLVDRGWIPQKHTLIDRPDSTQIVIGFLRFKSSNKFFTPNNDHKSHQIYHVDPEEIARVRNLTTLLPFYLVQEASLEIKTYPHPVGMSLNLRNHHLQYALIWYTLAVVLIIFYILYIRKKV